MNVASLDLCKELYELSGWLPPLPVEMHAPYAIPAYDLGFLLRKLPPQTKVFKARESTYGAYIGGVREKYKNYADTPEDAAAKLAIELFKQGVLNHAL